MFDVSIPVFIQNVWPSLLIHPPEYERRFEQQFYGDSDTGGTYHGTDSRRVCDVLPSPDSCLLLKSSTPWWLTFLIGSLLWPAPACWSRAASRALTSSAAACGQKSMEALYTTMARAMCSTISRTAPKCHRTWAKETVHWRLTTSSPLTAGPSVSTEKREMTSTGLITAASSLLWKVSIVRKPGLTVLRC